MRLRQSRRSVILGLSSLCVSNSVGCGSGSSGSGGASGGGGGDGSVSGGGGGAGPQGDYFPPNDSDAWEQADLVATGWSTDGLAALLDVAEANHSSSFMMLTGGRIVVESYFMGASAATKTDVASVQKSFTSTLIGLARDQGLLGLDDAVSDYLTPGWSNASPTEESAITLRHLMTHSSGLDPKTLQRVAEPGAVFDYNTNAYQKLRLVLESASSLGIDELTHTWLFDAIGVSGSWFDRGVLDPTGATTWGLKLSARDMARFGLFALRAGAWSSGPITNTDWFTEAWTSSPIEKDYGLLWWLQGKGTLKGKAPPDLVSALGAHDQKIYVVPSLDIVVTRQGLAAGTETEAQSGFDLVLLKAIADARA